MPPTWLLQSLVTCWMNPWSVDSDFLANMLRRYARTSVPCTSAGLEPYTAHRATRPFNVGTVFLAFGYSLGWFGAPGPTGSTES